MIEVQKMSHISDIWKIPKTLSLWILIKIGPAIKSPYSPMV